MSESTTWTPPSTGSSSLAERCTSHRRMSPTSAAFRSSPTRKWRRLRWSRGRNPAEAQSAELDAPGRVGWHELLAADWEKAFAFYGELLGWQKADSHTGVMGTYQGFSAGGETIGGMFTKPATLPLSLLALLFQHRRRRGGGEARRSWRRPNPLWPDCSAGRRLDRPLHRPSGRHIRAAGEARAQSYSDISSAPHRATLPTR